ATATGVNASDAGKRVTLALTDPDSNGVVPSSSPEFAGDFMLNSQGDEELIFSGAYTAVAPCNANNAPSACPGPGYPANSLGTISLETGAVGRVALNGVVTPKGLIFVPLPARPDPARAHRRTGAPVLIRRNCLRRVAHATATFATGEPAP